VATVVTVMDRPGFDQRTDNIVVVQPARHRLLWVPRDVWCDTLGDRVNGAFAAGGHDGLRRALASLGIEVDHSVCVPRAAVERALRDLVVTVPVPQPLRFWYPLEPLSRVQDGRKPVDFRPPSESLRGERIHQWLGARYGRDPAVPASDLARIRRQQVFVRALLRQGVDLATVLDDPEPPWASDPAAFDDLRRVRAWWRLATADQVYDLVIDGLQVLELRAPEPKPPRWRRAVGRGLGGLRSGVSRGWLGG
jgi:hypothetical protein